MVFGTARSLKINSWAFTKDIRLIYNLSLLDNRISQNRTQFGKYKNIKIRMANKQQMRSSDHGPDRCQFIRHHFRFARNSKPLRFDLFE